MLRVRYPLLPITITNEGLPGESAVQAASSGRLAGLLSANRPEVLLLLEGYNDLLLGGQAAISPATSALRTMVRDARGRGVQIQVAQDFGRLLPSLGDVHEPVRGGVELRDGVVEDGARHFV